MSCFVLFLGKARMPLSRLPHKLATHDDIDGDVDDVDGDDDDDEDDGDDDDDDEDDGDDDDGNDVYDDVEIKSLPPIQLGCEILDV